MSRETGLWKWLERANAMAARRKDLHMRRVENLVAEGDPDVEGCYRGGAFNIELKTSERPMRSTTRILGPSDVRRRQVPWARERWAAGGQTYFLIQVGSSHRAARYLVPGSLANKIVGATEGELASYSILENPLASPLDVVVLASSYRR